MTTDEKDMEPRTARIDIPDYHPRQGYNERTKTRKEILDRQIWHKIFLLCCVVAASLDPLFFYIPTINDQKKCLGMDEKLKKAVLALRSVMDLTYIFHIAFQIFYGYLAYALDNGESLTDKYVIRRMNRGGRAYAIVILQKKSVIQRINWWIIIIDILCVLPIPQVVILVYFSKMKDSESLNWRKFLNFILLFQFVPRIFRIYHSCEELTKNLSPRKIARAAWVKGLFNFFLYIIASHLFGAIWYFFSVHQELACWQEVCKENSMYIGMFTPALQSGIVNSMDFSRKFFYCFAWGLRNLSSFGSNLQTSTNFWESLFSAAITIIGLLLFIYLIGNLQTYLQFSANYSENRRRKMEKKEGEIDKWIKSNDIPRDMRKELKDRVRQKLDENDDVNLKNLLNVLPTQSKKRIKKHLCLPILKKVAALGKMSDKSIDEIIDHLKPMIFNENHKIFKENHPMRQMLFFTQGSTDVYSSEGGSAVELKKINFYGEEVLKRALGALPSEAPPSHASSSQAPSLPVPISQKTVETRTKVEAFALEVRDMKKIVNSLKLTPSNSTNVP